MNTLQFTSVRGDSIKTVAAPVESKGRAALKASAQNLLLHIPGEASGFYVMGVGALEKPTTGNLVLLFVLALVILVIVRWTANASRGILIASIGAFVVWMFILDGGLFRVLFPAALPGALGLIIAVFYSTVVTLLANAGKLK